MLDGLNLDGLAVKEYGKDGTIHQISFNKESSSDHRAFQTLHKNKSKKFKGKISKKETENSFRSKSKTSEKLDEVGDDELHPDAVKMKKFVKKQHPKMKKNYKDMKGKQSSKSFDRHQKPRETELEKMQVSQERVVEEKIGDTDYKSKSNLFEDSPVEDLTNSGSTHVVFSDRVAEENGTITNKTQFSNSTSKSNKTEEPERTESNSGKKSFITNRTFLMLFNKLP